MEIDIDIDQIITEVIDAIDLDDIADRVKEDLSIDDIVVEIIDSYEFDNFVYAAVEALLDIRLPEVVANAIGGIAGLAALTERVATLEAALGSASVSLAEPARRVLHGVEVSATTTGLF